MRGRAARGRRRVRAAGAATAPSGAGGPRLARRTSRELAALLGRCLWHAREHAGVTEAAMRLARLAADVGRRLRASEGQAAVEFVALLPIAVAVGLGILQALAAGAAGELADHAAQAGAVAIAQGGDGADAARRAVPGWARSRMQVAVRGGVVRVRLAPPSLLPGLGDRLAASARADAEPA